MSEGMRVSEYREMLGQRQKAYCGLFLDEKAVMVLSDLAKFCRAETSTFDADPRIHAVLEGRREVWLRIQDHLKLGPEEFLQKYTNQKIMEKRDG